MTGSAVTATGKVELFSTFAGSYSSLTAQLPLRYLMETLVSGHSSNSIGLIMSHDATEPINFTLFSGKKTSIKKWRLSLDREKVLAVITAVTTDMETSKPE